MRAVFRNVLSLFKPLSSSEAYFQIVGIAGILTCWLLVIVYWTTLPENIPLHFDWDGKPDEYGSRAAFFLLPVVAVILFLLIVGMKNIATMLSGKIDGAGPRAVVIAGRELAAAVTAESIGLLTYLQWTIAQVALAKQSELNVLTVIGFLFLFILTTLWFNIKLFRVAKIK